jgi:hypothetical protein
MARLTAGSLVSTTENLAPALRQAGTTTLVP